MSDDDTKHNSDCPDAGKVAFIGEGLAAVHHADHSTTLGLCYPAREGQPVPPGVMVIAPDKGGKTGRVIHQTPGHGPAQVSTDKYRSGWDRIFGGSNFGGSN